MSETWFEDIELAKSPFAAEVEAPPGAWPSESVGLPPSWPEDQADGSRGEQPFATEAWTLWAPAEAWSPEVEELTFDEAEEQAPVAGHSASLTFILALQKSLNTWRSEFGQTPIKEDGLPSAETRGAVLEFQKTSGLKRADSIPGPATRERLNLLLDILRNIPTSPLWIADRRRLRELVGSAGFRSLEEPTQTGVLKRILSYKNQPGFGVDIIRHQKNLVTEPGFELLPASSRELMVRVLAARPDDAELAGNLLQLTGSTEFRNLEGSTQTWVLKRIKAYAGNRTSIDNLENLITATLQFDQLSKKNRNTMLLALAAHPDDTLLVFNLRMAVERADFLHDLDQQAQTDVLNRIVTYPRAGPNVHNLMSLVTTPDFRNLAPAVSTQVLDGLPSRFGNVPLDPVSIGHMMSLLTASGFQKLRPEIRDLMLDALAERPNNMQLANGLRNLAENPRFPHDHRGARQSILQVVDSIRIP
jgi:Putative peptidoglycan binding domain